jgi:hypothetical protein
VSGRWVVAVILSLRLKSLGYCSSTDPYYETTKARPSVDKDRGGRDSRIERGGQREPATNGVDLQGERALGRL